MTNTNTIQRTWITIVGWSPMAVVNTLLQACEQGIVPQRIILLASPDIPVIQQNVDSVKKYINAILAEFGV